MSSLAKSISLLSSAASFEPIDPQERLLTRHICNEPEYFWPVDESELMRLKKVFNDDSIDIIATWVSRPRENCHSCGKQEEFIDHVYTAAKDGVHGATFMKKVLTGEIPAMGTGARHEVVCSHCDAAVQNIPWWAESPKPWRRTKARWSLNLPIKPSVDESQIEHAHDEFASGLVKSAVRVHLAKFILDLHREQAVIALFKGLIVPRCLYQRIQNPDLWEPRWLI
ncbi:hypothetical protein EDD11_009930 [Mortierella claussenii]|nr:hypothetical protein EDD11_009930 [Mortierella claussenii]